MTDERSSRQVLDPADRIAEILFGLIMVLTFTGSLSVADSGRDDVRAMLIGALGCNFAWGVIDGLFYLMAVLAEKGRNVKAYRAVLEATDAEQARRVIAASLPVVAAILKPAELDGLRERVKQLPALPTQARLDKHDWLGAIGVFLLVFLATLPVAVPFIFMQSLGTAMRVSNGIAVAMLFIAGYAYGKVVGRSPLIVGFGVVLVGILLVGFTIMLGG
jgi:hypothetical protein